MTRHKGGVYSAVSGALPAKTKIMSGPGGPRSHERHRV